MLTVVAEGIGEVGRPEVGSAIAGDEVGCVGVSRLEAESAIADDGEVGVVLFIFTEVAAMSAQSVVQDPGN